MLVPAGAEVAPVHHSPSTYPMAIECKGSGLVFTPLLDMNSNVDSGSQHGK